MPIKDADNESSVGLPSIKPESPTIGQRLFQHHIELITNLTQ